MKFGKQLEEYEVPHFKGHYINYTSLKTVLEAMKGCAASEPGTPLPRDQGIPEVPGVSPQEAWLREVEMEAQRVGDFVTRGLRGLNDQLRDLEEMSKSMAESPSGTGSPDASKHENEHKELRLLEAFGRVGEGLNQLRAFAEVNHAALYKILKKHDKVMGSKEGLFKLFPRLVEDTKLADMERMDSLEAELQRLSLSSSLAEGLNAGTSLEVARLCAGLGRTQAAALGDHFRSHEYRNEIFLSFFVGSSLSLMFSIIIALSLPAQDKHTFSEAYFLTPFPVFRVVFYLVLILWCMGAVSGVCDGRDINYMFILSVDPRCRVDPRYFFSRAAFLTTLWALFFGLYVIDYKWEILPFIGEKSGSRTSMHYVIYPVTLLVLAAMVFLWPSQICRNRYKSSVVSSVCRCMLAPMYAVDFCDNIVGDVLTSLAKPLQDLPAAVCYLTSAHPQTEEAVQRFIQMGDTCPDFVHQLFLPLIACLPYLFRAMQCVRRWYDTHEMRHLYNLGKYCASLLVVVVTNAGLQTGTVVATSLFATVYAGAWDLMFDWGLSRDELVGSAAKEEPGRRAARKPSRGPEMVATATTRSIKPERVERPARHFPRGVYWACSLADIIARFSWVITLMPIKIITDNITYRVLLVMVISSVEILRRSVWAILRVEYEQIGNGGGFRALLWVPSKLNQADKRARRSTRVPSKTPLLEGGS